MSDTPYRRANDKIHAREGLLMELKENQVKQAKLRNVSARRVAWSVCAACLALLVGIGSGVAIGRAGKSANSGVVAVADDSTDAPLAVTARSTEANAITRTVSTYDELFAVIEARESASANRYADKGDLVFGMGEMTNGVTTDATVSGNMADAPASDSASDQAADYSGTNNQVSGVDEADIVKTDGAYIYTLGQSFTLYITKVDGADMTITDTLTLCKNEDDSGYTEVTELFLAGDLVYAIGNDTRWNGDNNGTDTIIKVIDVSDRANAKVVATLTQDGYYNTARMMDGYLYVVSNYYDIVFRLIDNPVTFCPAVTVDGAQTVLPADDVIINDDTTDTSYTVVTSINAASGTSFASHKAMLGASGTVYCSTTHLFLTSYVNGYNENSEVQTDANGKHFVRNTYDSHTAICMLKLDAGVITEQASTTIEGNFLNQFSLDQYNGYLRVVVSRNSSTETIWTDGIDEYEWNSVDDNALYVLDDALRVVGTVENLGEDESVQSVRFAGDVAYFVTFRQVDPLFAVDLSDPASPTVLSALKISGFSAYLHAYSDGLLLGIGYDADETSGATQGVKISMFDVRDPQNVTEIAKLSVDADWTDVQYNHKGIYVNAAENLIAFPADGNYYVFRYTEGEGFQQLGVIENSESWNEIRGLHIGDTFYCVSTSRITALSLTEMKVLAALDLN